MLLTLLAYLPVAFAIARAADPTVTLDKATVIGTTKGSVTSYFGIPYAEPPYVSPLQHRYLCLTQKHSIDDLRLRLPVPITAYNETINATLPATQCIQLPPQPRSDLPGEILQDLAAYLTSVPFTSDAPQDEDCACAVVA